MIKIFQWKVLSMADRDKGLLQENEQVQQCVLKQLEAKMTYTKMRIVVNSNLLLYAVH